MSAAEITILVLVFLNVFCTALIHDKPRTGKYNGVAALIANIIFIALLYWAGLFR